MNKPALLLAVQAALEGDWDQSHKIAQDEWNSRYWYARTDGEKYEGYNDANAELIAIQNSLK